MIRGLLRIQGLRSKCNCPRFVYAIFGFLRNVVIQHPRMVQICTLCGTWVCKYESDSVFLKDLMQYTALGYTSSFGCL